MAICLTNEGSTRFDDNGDAEVDLMYGEVTSKPIYKGSQ